MGIRDSKELHYSWRHILPQHFEQTARRCGLGNEIGRMMQEVIEHTAPVIDSVQRLLPTDFPQELAEAVLGGLRAAAERLADNQV
ncbi:MAG: hypothetical protein QM718_06965 [Steroidobacteraceae bacterium]